MSRGCGLKIVDVLKVSVVELITMHILKSLSIAE